MVDKRGGDLSQFFNELNIKIRDIETRQRSLNDRMILVAENLIDFKEKYNEKQIEVKKSIELINQSVDRMKSFLETIRDEFPKFAKKRDLEILEKQAKMFKPLELINNLSNENERI